MTRKHLSLAAATGLVALFLSSAAAQAQAAKPATAAKPSTANVQSIPPQVDAAFAAWDVDRNGALSLQEFRNGWALLRRAGEMEARLHGQFVAVDANRNGGIDPDEYANLVLVKKAGKSAPLLSAFDANKNQRLEFSEYVAFVRRMSQASAQPAPVAPRKSP